MFRTLTLAACLTLPGMARAQGEPPPLEEEPPVIKTPLIVVGGMLTAVGVGALWVGSADNSLRQPPLRDPGVVAGAALVTTGVGMMTVGLLIDANGNPVPGVTVRF